MTGLQYNLSEGEITLPPAVVRTEAQSRRLSAAETQKVLDRLPALELEEVEVKEFALPKETFPAPRPGRTIDEPFPPPESEAAPDRTAAEILKIIRFAPQGRVGPAPRLSVTFSQPMVELTAHEDLQPEKVIRLSPQPPGVWRWVGTKTLVFEPEHRFPMATDYTVEIPAGTVSTLGGRLEEAFQWSFSTPPPTVETFLPGRGPQRLTPVIFVSFDQKVDPQQVMKTMTLQAGFKKYGLLPATEEDLRNDPKAGPLAEKARPGRWAAFRPAEALPVDSEIKVILGPKTPSAEGPLQTEKPQKFSFRTYGRFKLMKTRCGWGDDCRPLTPWEFQFSNQIDAANFDRSLIRIEPELPGGKIWVSSDSIFIKGFSQGQTNYRITFPAGLQDIFGQTLEQEVTAAVKVDSSHPVLSVPAGDFTILDPAAEPVFSVYTINYERLKVRVYEVQAEDYPSFRSFYKSSGSSRSAAEMPGRLVFEDTLSTKGEPEQMVQTTLDLTPWLPGGLGHLIVAVEPDLGLFKSLFNFRQEKEPLIYTWVQATRIGLDAFSDDQDLLVWANSLVDGAPLSGVRIKLAPGGPEVETNADGLARLTLPRKKTASIIVAHQGQDKALLRKNRYWWGDDYWRRRKIMDSLHWYVFDDRKMYRPGEEVSFKGWLRQVGGGKDGDVGPADENIKGVKYTIFDPRGNELQKGRLRLNALGGFNLAYTLPVESNLGEAVLTLEAVGAKDLNGRKFYHHFEVQEFRRPEFEVSTAAGEGPYLVGDQAVVSVSAKYYAGGPLSGAEVTWKTTSSPGHFHPPGWSDFSFGHWTPWWFDSFGAGPDETEVKTLTGRTDALGAHRMKIDFTAVDPPRASSVTAEATVMDVNRQAWTSSQHLLVHPAEHYVGLKSRRIFVEQGQPMLIEAIVTDLDGRALPGREIHWRAVRLDWNFKDGQWLEEETEPQEFSDQSDGKPIVTRFQFPHGGTYRITALIKDDQGRVNQTRILTWVSGGARPRADKVEQEKLELIPDRRDYQADDQAEILVQAPFWPAEGLVTYRRSGLVESKRFTMDGPSYTLKVPIIEDYTPNLHVQVDLVGAAPRTDDAGREIPGGPKRPAYASGTIDLSVPPVTRMLDLEVKPAQIKLEPGGTTKVDLLLQDNEGRPVSGGEVALVVVDEAVLALTGYHLADPISVFYTKRSAAVDDYHTRQDILLIDPAELMDSLGEALDEVMDMALEEPKMALRAGALAPPAPGEANGPENGDQARPIKMRQDFRALAVFAPEVPTDAQGRASVEVRLPDSLTRYRIMAVAVAEGKRFGLGEASITARLPLMVRPSPPRFLRFGDRFELPLVLQNQTDQDMEVDLALRTVNCQLEDKNGRRVIVPADDRVEVLIPAAAVNAGQALIQVGAVSENWSDAARFTMPVWTPATTEAMAVYGEIDAGAVAQPVKPPENVFPQFGGLEITTSSTALQALSEAVLYLTSYPFECSEQLASRLLAVVALKDVLAAFNAKGLPSPEKLKKAVQRDIELLKRLQNNDGGFPLWQKGKRSWPFHSIHAAHALWLAREKGFNPPPAMLDKVQHYLQRLERNIPEDYSRRLKYTLQAYALYVRSLMGEKVITPAVALIKEAGLDNLPLEAVGWLLSVLSGSPAADKEVKAILRHLGNRVEETAGTAHFVTAYEDGAYLLLASDRRTDAVILEALIKDRPDNDLIPKIVRGLMAHRKRGRWDNTQDNVFILLALNRYFQTYEAQDPDFTARVWLGGQFAGRTRFRGRSADYHRIEVPMAYLAEQGPQEVILDKQGRGRLYYRLGIRYAPRDLDIKPSDHGFTVERTYEPLDNPEEVKLGPDGAWHIKAGARVKVRLTIAAPSRRYHVALVDPLPAGFEVMNPDLAVTGSLPRDEEDNRSRPFWWWGLWYEHQNLRDDRVEAFASLLWDGVYTYTYGTRATTPGRFIAGPVKAEEMYAPETFGRGRTEVVIIE